jgi:CHASE2 domain-containing sensor protein
MTVINGGLDGPLIVFISYPTLIESAVIAAVAFILLFAKRKSLKRGAKIALAVVGSVALCVVLLLGVLAVAFGSNSYPPAEPHVSLEVYLVSGALPPGDESEIVRIFTS